MADTAAEQEVPVLVSASTLSGRAVLVKVPSVSTVACLKEALAAELQVMAAQLSLVALSGSVVRDDSPVLDYLDGGESSGSPPMGSPTFTVVVAMPVEVANGLKLLQDEERPTLRRTGARALGMLGPAAMQATDALELILDTDHDQELRIEAAWALGRVGLPVSTAVPALLRCVKECCGERPPGMAPEANPLAETRLVKIALEALVHIGGETVPFLVQALLSETDRSLRASLVRTLGQIGEAAALAIPGLERVVETEQHDPGLRREVATAIGKIGKEALPALERLLKHWDEHVCKGAADAIVATNSSEAIPMLMRAAMDPRSLRGRSVSAKALAQVGPEARPFLEQLARSRDTAVCAAAASSLGQLGDAASVPVLVELLADGDWDACVAATSALGQMGPAGISWLPHAAQVDYWAVHDTLFEVLEGLGEPGVPVLVQMLGAGDVQFRVRAAATLGRIGPAAAGAVVALEDALAPCNPPVLIMAAAETLGSVGKAASSSATALVDVLMRPTTPDDLGRVAGETLAQFGEASVAALERCLQQPQLRVRARHSLAISVFGRLGAVAVLVRCLEHPIANVRQEAACALGLIGPSAAEATPELGRAAQDSDLWVRFEAVEALGKIGPGAAAATAHLVDCLGDSHTWVQAGAACSLGKLAVETQLAVAALRAAQRLATEREDPELQETCRRALLSLTFATRKCCFTYVHRKVIEVAARAAREVAPIHATPSD